MERWLYSIISWEVLDCFWINRFCDEFFYFFLMEFIRIIFYFVVGCVEGNWILFFFFFIVEILEFRKLHIDFFIFYLSWNTKKLWFIVVKDLIFFFFLEVSWIFARLLINFAILLNNLGLFSRYILPFLLIYYCKYFEYMHIKKFAIHFSGKLYLIIS